MELCNYPCADQTRYYEIETIQIPIVYNKYGDHDPNGKRMQTASAKRRCAIFPKRAPSLMKK